MVFHSFPSKPAETDVSLCDPACKLVASLKFLEINTTYWSVQPFRLGLWLCFWAQSHDQDLAAAVQSLQGQFQVLQAEKRQVQWKMVLSHVGVGGI